jgi:hypothetical protein
MKSIFGARRRRPEPHPLEATTVWKEYQKAKEHKTKAVGARRKRLAGIALGVLAVVGIVVAIVALVLGRQGEQTLPSDARARSEFVNAQDAKLSDEERRLLTRFLARVQMQEAAGGPAPKVTIAKAIELQRSYDNDVAQAQTRYQQQLDAAKADVRIDVRERSIVKEDPTKSTAGKSLRYAMDINNIGKRAIDSLTLRVEFRDSSGKYLAATPSLELKGPLKPGESGRTAQTLPPNPNYHQYILDGGTVQIRASPVQVVYADGAKLDADQALKALETLSRLKIE